MILKPTGPLIRARFQIIRTLVVSTVLIFGSVSVQADAQEHLLLERQKTLYRESQHDVILWDAFFGGAAYLRSIGSPQVIDHSLAMELMALARHCQWAAILSFGQIHRQKKNFPLSAKAMDLIRLKKGFQSFISDPKNSSEKLITALPKIRDQWALTQRELQLLSHPENIRLRVRSQCD